MKKQKMINGYYGFKCEFANYLLRGFFILFYPIYIFVVFMNEGESWKERKRGLLMPFKKWRKIK